MSRPATRVLALLELLQDRGLVSADELARRLEVDARAVRRYITALRELDIPVESVRGRYGGYRLSRSYRVPPLMLANEEAVAVVVALATASRRENVGEPTPTDRALIKLNRVLPVALRERVQRLAAATSVSSASPLAPEPELALTLAAAVHARQTVRIEHAHRVRDVDPYGLVVHTRHWYLVGHDHLRDAIRMFRLDRITDATELPRRFTPPEGFDPKAHVLHALTLGAWTHRAEIWLDTDLATARTRLTATFGELQPCAEGGVLLVSGAEDLPAMARILAGLPWRFTIRTPPALAAALAAHVTALTEAVTRSRHAQP
ncbi:helix-turn-helix transcriptional regulator [Nonomuraea africana]|uniref:DNA-binding transcriptional regulator YafY n=1 Tax=Nonomuraea africana TaxID=46171 RepID=A0ABR9K696_9ACTN|nr:WYL domain-containing protein [Nonomuraea africana]MBE1557534.1 putative DNA-binding transcriptional regulator YafY [Nonomuraea africana]